MSNEKQPLMMRHTTITTIYDLGYGSYGVGGAGLPGGKAGPGSKPGYPFGTGKYFKKL